MFFFLLRNPVQLIVVHKGLTHLQVARVTLLVSWAADTCD